MHAERALTQERGRWCGGAWGQALERSRRERERQGAELQRVRRELSGLRGDRNYWRAMQRKTGERLRAARARERQLEREPLRRELAAERRKTARLEQALQRLEGERDAARRERDATRGELERERQGKERLARALAERTRERDAARAERERVLGQNRWLKKQGFGKRSEKRRRGRERSEKRRHGADAGAGREPGQGRGRQPGTPSHPRAPRQGLEVQLERREPPAEACRCPRCGKEYGTHGTETSEYLEIEVKAHKRRVLRTRRRPACRCPQAREAVAPAPPRLFHGTPYGVSVWALYLVESFVSQRPLRAVARQFELYGLPVAAGTLASSHARFLQLFAPLEAAIAARQEAAAVVHGDETRWTIHALGERGDSPRCWLWVCLSADAVHLRIDPARSAAAAAKLFGKIGRQGRAVLVCDRYSAYGKLAREHAGQVELAFCWAHVRRDFLALGVKHAQWQAWADSWVEGIGALYGLNRARLAAWDPARPLDGQEAACEREQALLASAVTALFRQASASLQTLAADDPRRKPLQSLLKHRAGLEVFVASPAVPMDNNPAERALRGPVIGRKLSFGSFSEQGARLRGRLLSVYGTLARAGIDPYRWTLAFLQDCADRGGAPTAGTPWMPWGLDPQLRRALERPAAAGPAP